MTTPSTLPPTIIHYIVTAEYHHDTLPRVMALFARHDIIPDLVKASQYKSAALQDERLTIDIHVSGLTEAFQKILLEKLRGQAMVHAVREEILFQKASLDQNSDVQLAS